MPRVTRLEDRIAPDCAITAIAGNVLVINGDADFQDPAIPDYYFPADTITITNGPADSFTVNCRDGDSPIGKTSTFSSASFDTINVNAGIDNDILIINLSSGVPMNGTNEIKINVDLGSGADTLTVLGNNGGIDKISLGFLGINLNGDGDFEIQMPGGNNATVERYVVDAQGGDDIINAGGDSVVAGAFNPTNAFTIIGGDGNDSLVGSLGNDSIDGGSQSDTISGGQGGDDTLIGGGAGAAEGIDVLQETGDVDMTLTTVLTGFGNDILSGLEEAHLTGGPSGNKIDASGFAGAVTLVGLGGDDTLIGGNQNDHLNGGDGNDNLVGNKGADTLDGGDGTNTLSGGEGDDSLTGIGTDLVLDVGDVNFVLSDTSLTGLGTDKLTSVELAHLSGGASANLIDASAFTGSATLLGLGGNDSLISGKAGDSLIGGAGDDTFVGNMVGDSVDGGSGSDLIIQTADLNMALTDTTIAIGAGSGSLTGIELAKLTGGPSNNSIDTSKFNGTVSLDGSTGNDSLLAGGGNDLVTGGDGNDSLAGGAGNDVLDGGTGTDRLVDFGDVNFILTDANLTGSGTDVLISIEQASLTGGAGNNTMDASAFTLGDVSLNGAGGNDSLIGSKNDDSLAGGDGNDTLVGNDGNDTGFAGIGNDALFGGDGNDSLVGNDGNDGIEGGLGDDTLDGGFGTDNLSGQEGNDSLLAGDGNDALDGGADDDTLEGGGGNDNVNAGDGNDSVGGGAGNDALFGGTGNDTFSGGSGVDLIAVFGNANFTLTDTSLTGLENEVLNGDIEQVSIVGGAGNNIINASGFSGRTTIEGAEGNDSLIGGAGVDLLLGGIGNDTLRGGPSDDTIDGGPGIDKRGDTIGNDVLFNMEDNGTTVNTITGTSGDDLIDLTGKTGPFFVDGLGGNDTIIGSSAADTLIGGPGDDSIIGGKGADSIEGADGNDTLRGGRGRDTIVGGSGLDELLGGKGADFLNAFDSEADLVRGGLGADDCDRDAIDTVTACEA